MIRRTLGELDANDLGRHVLVEDQSGLLRRVEHMLGKEGKAFTFVILQDSPTKRVTLLSETLCTVEGVPRKETP